METIPNLHIETIGSKKKPVRLIKGDIHLPCWNGYYLYDDSFTLQPQKVVTDGQVILWVDDALIDNSIQTTTEQVNAYWFLVEQQQAIKHSILQALKKEFPNLRATDYASWEDDDPSFPRPEDLTAAFDFRDFAGPESVSLSAAVKDGSAYVQWHFLCRWDIEHGLDVVTHKDRVIEIAPHADPWKIYADNNTLEQMRSEYKDWQLPRQKKWWQFWR